MLRKFKTGDFKQPFLGFARLVVCSELGFMLAV